MRGGRAIAEFMLGRIEPSGRLPLGVPRSAGQLPVYCGQVRGHYGRFGEGLGCTTVNYSEPTIQNCHVAGTHRLPSLDGDAGQPSC
ncbi:hypothetical protein ACH40F_58185 [Streptomyces sp. NPDC020794]|uniref:hypothetical protein n=1 Tax=unclassified Streptomyces TaxID=2593676 RepID=UPI0036E31601